MTSTVTLTATATSNGTSVLRPPTSPLVKDPPTYTSYSDWFQYDIWPRIYWLHFGILFGLPLIGLYGLLYVTPSAFTVYFSLFYYFFTGLGITAGYHRLFAHRAYKTHWISELLMMIMGTGALQGSIKWWASKHRVHHRYTDTKFDPYNSKDGFFYAHVGWMLVHPHPQYNKYADIKDLNESPFVRYQHTHYLWMGPLVSLVVPTVVCGLVSGDWLGGYFYAGVLRQVFVHHTTFCVNSVAHFFGDLTFDDSRTPRDNIVTAFLTLGEGYHNFHHEFPNDYRNGIQWYDYDPTKWLINALAGIGLAHKLRVFPNNEIEMGKAAMIEKRLHKLKENIVYPKRTEELPVYTLQQFSAMVANEGRLLTIVNNIVFEIPATFISEHPGGQVYIKSAIGTDITERYFGLTGIYKHSNAAINFLNTNRIGRIHRDDEKDVIPYPSNELHEARIPKGIKQL